MKYTLISKSEILRVMFLNIMGFLFLSCTQKHKAMILGINIRNPAIQKHIVTGCVKTSSWHNTGFGDKSVHVTSSGTEQQIWLTSVSTFADSERKRNVPSLT